MRRTPSTSSAFCPHREAELLCEAGGIRNVALVQNLCFSTCCEVFSKLLRLPELQAPQLLKGANETYFIWLSREFKVIKRPGDSGNHPSVMPKQTLLEDIYKQRIHMTSPISLVCYREVSRCQVGQAWHEMVLWDPAHSHYSTFF